MEHKYTREQVLLQSEMICAGFKGSITISHEESLKVSDMLRAYAKTLPEPLTPDTIDWSHVDERFKWMARDEDGKVHLCEFNLAPSDGWEKWFIDEAGCDRAGRIISMEPNCAIATAFASYNRGTVDWKDSLVKRPDNE